MSCFICDDAHITALAAYAVHHRLADVLRVPAFIRLENAKRSDAKVLAIALRYENVESFRARYEGRHESDITDFEFQTDTATAVRVGAFSPIAIIKSAQCFAYQACEHDSWEGSLVKGIIDRIISHAIHELPGYNEAAWGAPECAPVTPPVTPIAAPVAPAVKLPEEPAPKAPKATKRAKPAKRLAKVAFGGRIISRPTI